MVLMDNKDGSPNVVVDTPTDLKLQIRSMAAVEQVMGHY